MPARVVSFVLVGVEGARVDVEADTLGGNFGITIVGLPDAVAREARERLLPAIKNSLSALPTGDVRYAINLAPASLPKQGAGLDLPMALGLLATLGRLDRHRLNEYGVVGELALDGRLRPINGVLSLAEAARREGLRGLVVPTENADEAALVEDIQAIPAESLAQAFNFLNGDLAIEPRIVDVPALFNREARDDSLDFRDVIGQEGAKRALEIVAAGGHNAVLIGPPGSGKTLMLRRLPTILPSMTLEEALETTRVHSIKGELEPGRALVAKRPFRPPHHSVSHVALVGGGVVPKPGEVSMAHHGVLFLDELPEFPRNALEALRQPLEDGFVTVSRARMTARFPAKFILAAAMNPCPCGYLGHPTRPCSCRAKQVRDYRSRVSGPLLDRVDLHIEAPPVDIDELTRQGVGRGETSEVIRARVQEARERQRRRYAPSHPGIHCNAQLTPRALRETCRLEPDAVEILKRALTRLGLSARAHDRIIRVGRTIADLAGAEVIRKEFIAEAIQYRTLDRPIG
jgi:magnesium chelatase family protein